MKTLSDESKIREKFPISSGCLEYFPAAIAGVAYHSFIGGAKYNDGGLVHLRYISTKHRDCIQRHLMDLNDLLAAELRGITIVPCKVYDFEQKREVEMDLTIAQAILIEANALAWRALATSQELHEKYGGQPLAPAARTEPPTDKKQRVTLLNFGKDKVAVVKALREIYNYSLKEAVDVVNNLPTVLDVPDNWQNKKAHVRLEVAGARVE